MAASTRERRLLGRLTDPGPVEAASETAWWTVGAEDVALRLGASGANGLTMGEAQRRLAAFGPNELTEAPGTPAWRTLADQFASTMILVLVGCAVVTVLVGDLTDTAVIVAVVCLNALLGFVQERRAERAVTALRRMTAASARVVRDGTVRDVKASEVVVGDLLVVDAGDVVAADARLVDAPQLRVDEAALTGESVPVEKTAVTLSHRGGRQVSDRLNMVFKGTAVVHGRARALVVETGMATELGRIAGLLQQRRSQQTPLQRRLAGLGRTLALAALVVCGVVFVMGVARGEGATRMLLVAVTLAVAAIPESLPAVVTVSLALGAQRMARRHAVIRKLPAVETLGSVTVIATDKTGTLTQNKMLVERVWTPETGELEVTGSGYEPTGELLRRAGSEVAPAPIEALEAIERLLTATVLCNDAALVAPTGPGDEWAVAGGPTEAALLTLAAKVGKVQKDLVRLYPRIAEMPFDAARRRMTTLHRTPEGGVLAVCKGATEVVLPLVENRDEVTTSGYAGVDRARAWAEAQAAAGYRVMALAGQPVVEDVVDAVRADPLAAERDLELLGLVAMTDPPREEAAAAVAAARAAGITPVMITGDHPATARAIGRRLGFVDGAGVMSGEELEALGPEALFLGVDRVGVFARTTSEQKLDIVDAWQRRGAVVAMTGDGVNDAPALRAADIGVAMGRAGTEVSKEAADMVLTDDNFATIVAAVREGRRIYDNIRRFVAYGLTGGSAEIWVMLIAPFLGFPLPLLPVQILWVNLLTHGLPGVALGVEPAEADAMHRPPRPPTESIFARGLWQRVLVFGLITAAITLGLGCFERSHDGPWQTMVFTSLALLQLGCALSVRSEHGSSLRLGLQNRPLVLAVVGMLFAQLAAIYWGPLQALLETEPLGARDLGLVLLASTGTFWAMELHKLVQRTRGCEHRGAAARAPGPQSERTVV